MRGTKVLGGLVALAAGMASLPASAAIVQLCGPTICYEYDNNPLANAGLTLFGAPTLLGGSDTLSFTPTSFNADSDPGTLAIPSPIVSAVFQFTKIFTTNGGEIASITVTESGDYQILDGGPDTGFVNVNMRLQSVDLVDNGAVTPGFPEVTSPLFNWNSTTPTGFGLANWSLSGTINPAALFTDLATELDLQIQNTLQACSSLVPSECSAGTGDDYAFIAKKLTLEATSTVPVPPAVWLFGSAVGLLGWMRRRASPGRD